MCQYSGLTRFGLWSDSVQHALADLSINRAGATLAWCIGTDWANGTSTDDGPENALIHVYASYILAHHLPKDVALHAMNLREDPDHPNRGTWMDMENNQTGVNLADSSGNYIDLLVGAQLVWLDGSGIRVRGVYPHPDEIRRLNNY